MRRSVRSLGILLVSLLAWASLAGGAVKSGTREYEIKAAFIYNFARFVEWPAESLGTADTLILGVLGEDPFGPALERLEGKAVQGHRIEIKRFATLDEFETCHILFVSSEGQELDRILREIPQSGVLTVGEQSFAQSGGVIAFVVRRNMIRFQINVAAGARAGLKISSQLLKLAELVE